MKGKTEETLVKELFDIQQKFEALKVSNNITITDTIGNVSLLDSNELTFTDPDMNSYIIEPLGSGVLSIESSSIILLNGTHLESHTVPYDHVTSGAETFTHPYTVPPTVTVSLLFPSGPINTIGIRSISTTGFTWDCSNDGITGSLCYMAF